MLRGGAIRSNRLALAMHGKICWGGGYFVENTWEFADFLSVEGNKKQYEEINVFVGGMQYFSYVKENCG